MKIIEKGKKQYNIPERYEELTFVQYLQLVDYINETTDRDISDDEFYQELWEIITDEKPENLHELPIVNYVTFTTCMGFLSTEKFPEVHFHNYLEIDGYRIKTKSFNKFNFGEYIDIQHLISQNNNKNMVAILSKICDIYKHKKILGIKYKLSLLDMTDKEKQLFIQSLPATHMQSILSFFLLFRKVYMSNMLHYIRKQVKVMKHQRRFQMIGLIISIFKMHVMKILPKWKQS